MNEQTLTQYFTARLFVKLPSSSVLVVAPTHQPEVQFPQGTGAQVETGVPFVPDALAQPSGSSTTLILIEGNEKANESMPPPPARKEIVLALHASSATPIVQPKGRKRKCVRGNDGESSQHEGLNLASGLRGKFVSLIDGMISECGSEVSHLARDLTEMQGRLSESGAMLKSLGDSHSAKVSKLEVQIGELERDLGNGYSVCVYVRGAMTISTYVSCYCFDLIPYRFKVRDRFSAYMTCLRYYPCVGCMRVIFARWLSLFRTLGVRCDQQRTWWISSTRFLAGSSFLGVFTTPRNAKDQTKAIGNIPRPTPDRSEYDDQNTDESSSIVTQLPYLHAVRSLRSDRASILLGRYVATELGPRSVAT
ncbi:hypothetical protein F2Q69_00009659 [Brassica cretica]|uniref:Uncharacterized protein n=1 Tax=Brassica cretica TaxID=69181 RepID=A0A8S9PF01_BRACR|nr:hypothetical protein F2Q69_00009659 [Brassica cretica]